MGSSQGKSCKSCCPTEDGGEDSGDEQSCIWSALGGSQVRVCTGVLTVKGRSGKPHTGSSGACLGHNGGVRERGVGGC